MPEAALRRGAFQHTQYSHGVLEQLWLLPLGQGALLITSADRLRHVPAGSAAGTRDWPEQALMSILDVTPSGQRCLLETDSAILFDLDAWDVVKRLHRQREAFWEEYFFTADYCCICCLSTSYVRQGAELWLVMFCAEDGTEVGCSRLVTIESAHGDGGRRHPHVCLDAFVCVLADTLLLVFDQDTCDLLLGHELTEGQPQLLLLGSQLLLFSDTSVQAFSTTTWTSEPPLLSPLHPGMRFVADGPSAWLFRSLQPQSPQHALWLMSTLPAASRELVRVQVDMDPRLSERAQAQKLSPCGRWLAVTLCEYRVSVAFVSVASGECLSHWTAPVLGFSHALWSVGLRWVTSRSLQLYCASRAETTAILLELEC